MHKAIMILSPFIALGAVLAVHAQTTSPFKVTATHLKTAGYSSVTDIAPEDSRFAPPVRYFRVGESIPETDVAHDCSDCANLVVVYVGMSTTVPDWHASGAQSLRIVGGRAQARRYLPGTKTVIIVTGPEFERVTALSDLLANATAKHTD